MNIKLNTIPLNVINLNANSVVIKKIIRYVPDDQIPETHIEFYSDSEIFLALDGGFYTKL